MSCGSCSCRIHEPFRYTFPPMGPLSYLRFVGMQCGLIVGLTIVMWGHVPAAHATAAPIAHWRFDEGTGTSVYDEGVRTVTGSFMTPNPTWTTDVAPVSFTNPYALKFESTGDGVQFAWPSALNFTGTAERSFSFWYKPTANGETASGNYDRIMSWSGDAFEIAGTLGNVAVHRLAFYDGSWRDTGYDLTPGNWYNITFTYDGSSVKLFVSGVQKFSGSSGGRDINGTLYIGVRHTGDEGINGIIDDVRMFDYALTSDQINNIVAGSDNPDAAPAPTLSGALLPADNATSVSSGSNLVMNFSTAVQTGTGTITIKRSSDNATVETINATGARVTGSGSRAITINPTDNLAEGTSYYVLVHANAFKNGAGVYYEGISTTTAWNFTTDDDTAPVLSGVTATASGSTAATITWATSESGSTRVVYGLTSSYGNTTSTTNTSPRVRSHSKYLSSLTACTTYHYSARSTDSFSNTGSSIDMSFTTGGCVGGATIRASTGSSLITNGNGSTGSILLSGTGRSLSVSVPSGYVATNATCPTGAQFQLKEMASGPVQSTLGAPSGRGTIVLAHSLSAFCPNLTPVTSFDRSLTITIAYADGDISGLVESSLGVYRYDTDSAAWEELTCSQSASSNTLTCSTVEFSSFGVFGTPVSSSSGSDPGGGSGGVGGCRGRNCQSLTRENPFAGARTQAQSKDPVLACTEASLPQDGGYVRVSVRGRPVTFRDVAADQWFACPVYGAVERGAFGGYSDARGNPTGYYGPADTFTLGQLAAVAVRLAGQNVVPGRAGDHWASSYMEAAQAMGWSVFQRKLHVEMPATRGMVLQTVLESLGISLTEDAPPYADVPAGSLYSRAVATATLLGIVSGDDGADTFRPNAPINRAEVAKMVILALAAVR